MRSTITDPPDPISPTARATALLSQTHVILQVLVVVVGTAAGVWVLYKLAAVVFVLILAALFAYLIAPLVQMAQFPMRIAGRRRHLPRGIAIALVYVILAGTASTGAALMLPSATEQIDDMVSRAPAYAQSFETWKHAWAKYYQRLKIPIELRQTVDHTVDDAGDATVESVRGSAMAVVDALPNLPWLVLIPILAFFLLKDAAGVRRAIVTTLPHRIQLRGHRLFEELNATLATYVRAQLLACLLVGTLCGVGFAMIGISYPVPLGVLAGVLEFIPLVGPLLLAIVASIVGALHAPILVLWVVGFLAVLRVVEDYVIYPRLIRRGIHLHPLAVIIAVLAGAELDGVAGMFLAVPAVAIASVVYRHCLKWCGDEDASDAALRPSEHTPLSHS